MWYDKTIDEQSYANKSRIQSKQILGNVKNTFGDQRHPCERPSATDDLQGKEHTFFRTSIKNNIVFKLTNATNADQQLISSWLKSLKYCIVKLLLDSFHRSVGQVRFSKRLPLLDNTPNLVDKGDADYVSKYDVVNERARFGAGSDRPGGRKCISVSNNNCCNTQNGRGSNAQRPFRTIWNRNENHLPSLRTAFQDPSHVITQPRRTMPHRSKIPVPCGSLPPRRQDMPVQLYFDSRLPVPIRSGPAPARVLRPRSNKNNVRRSRSMSCGRRCTYDVKQEQDPCGNRRGTCDAPKANCGGPRMRSGTFTMSGTIRLDDHGAGFSAGRPVTRAPSVRFCSPPNTGQTVEEFLDNQCNFDTVAPRSLAVPGCPYVSINDSGSSSVPEQWSNMLTNRSSNGSQVTRFADEYNCGYPSADRDSRPFGINDSFFSTTPSTTGRAADHNSRTRSVDRGQVCSRRRDFTYDRHFTR